MKNIKFVIIALMSATLISLEIVWTRIFSAEFFYTFAFLILSLSILGLGLGALAFRLFSFLNREKALGLFLTLTSLLALIGPPVVLNIKLDFSKLFSSWEMIWKFILTVSLLSSAFFAGGIALAKLFRDNYEEMPGLYMYDLIGAGTGALLAILFMNLFSTPNAAFLICIPMIIASFLALKKYRYVVALPVILMVFLIYYSGTLLNPPRKERAPVIYQYWDAMAKIKIFDYGKDSRGINIDNAANTPVHRFDGNWNKPDSLKYDFGIFSLKNFIKPHGNSCVVLSLGAGGGGEVLQALQEGAFEIHAVEVNPKINSMMLDGELSGFSGNLYKDSRVKVITEDGRAYVRRFTNKFDLITSFSSNTFAALASGSFALAENYLFTTEAFEDYYKALSDDGMFFMEHQMYMPKIVSEVLTALNNLGVRNPENHIAVYDLPKHRRNILIISKNPINDEFRNNAIVKLSKENYPVIHLLYPAEDSTSGNIINKVVTEGWQNVSASVDLTPCDDNRPYIAQMGLWKNLDFKKLNSVTPWEFKGFPLSKMIISIILIIISILILPLMFIPYFFKGPKLKAMPFLYFFAIGVAFMIIEVVLIQRYTLFIGASSYTFVIVLLTLLVSSGIGSRCSRNFSDKTPFFAIVFWLMLEVFVFRYLTNALAAVDLSVRIALTILLISPVGFFMGMPFPKAAKKVGELIDWGFAVNGVASVIGSTAIILITINYGFSFALSLAGLFYLSAVTLISLQERW